MSKLSLIASTLTAIACAAGLGCTDAGRGDIPAGQAVTIELPDGSMVTGRIADAALARASATDPAPLAAERPALNEATDAGSPVAGVSSDEHHTPPQRVHLVVPTGTMLFVELDTSLASDRNRVEDPVHARIQHDVVLDDVVAIPAGSHVQGVVTTARASGKVKGAAQLGIRFDHVDISDTRYEIVSSSIAYRAASSKKADAARIGIGAGAGALIGGLLGGGKGAGTGAAIGGGAGTAMVLATAGSEVELPRGTKLEIELTEPLVVESPLATD